MRCILQGFWNLFKIDISVFVFLILSMPNELEIFGNFTRLMIYNFSNFIIELLYMTGTFWVSQFYA